MKQELKTVGALVEALRDGVTVVCKGAGLAWNVVSYKVWKDANLVSFELKRGGNFDQWCQFGCFAEQFAKLQSPITNVTSVYAVIK